MGLIALQQTLPFPVIYYDVPRSSTPILQMSLSHTHIAIIDAVREACTVTRAVQQELCAGDVMSKRDRSPVTVADFAAQAVIARRLASLAPGCTLVGEESAEALRTPEQAGLRDALVQRLRPVWADVNADDALAAIDFGRQAPCDRFWTLDPIDGTKGFLRNGQYAISLAYIEYGQVLFGVLGCPNLSSDWDRPFDDPDAHGLIIYAVRGFGAWSTAADDRAALAVRLHSRPATGTGRLRLCESIASGHSDRKAVAEIVESLGGATSLRLDSQAKYAIVARGQADAYMRIPPSDGRREYIWDHAPGAIIAEEAGVTVGGILGEPYDFEAGRKLEHNRGVLVARGDWHARLVDAVNAAARNGNLPALADRSKVTLEQDLP